MSSILVSPKNSATRRLIYTSLQREQFNYTRALRIDDKPNYSYLRKLFRDLFVRESYQYEYVFDFKLSVQRGAQEEGNPGMFSYIDFYFYKLIYVLVDTNPATSSTCPITTKMATTITTCLPLSPPPQRRVNTQKYDGDDDAGVGEVKKGSNDSGLGMSFLIRLFILFTNNVYSY